jgi:AmiR/NasT family two-component response regulator
MTRTPSFTGQVRDRACSFWIGPTADEELAVVRSALEGQLDLVDHATVDDAVAWEVKAGRRPDLVLLAADRPGRWPLEDVAAATRRWPLAAVVGVATSLGEGRRRSGPTIAGIEEVAWHDLPGRLECWLAARAAGRPGALGVPATARREERLLEMLDAVAGLGTTARDQAVWIAAGRSDDLDGLADLLALAGRRLAGRTHGRPPLDLEAALLVWDVVAIGADDLAWLRMLTANRPRTRVVLLESFPRGDAVEAALRAGAGAVLGRPIVLEALEGTLRRLERRSPGSMRPNGVGADAGHR